MTDDVTICEYRSEDIGEPLKKLWLALVKEMFEIKRHISPLRSQRGSMAQACP
jgi:hypothetical protein